MRTHMFEMPYILSGDRDAARKRAIYYIKSLDSEDIKWLIEEVQAWYDILRIAKGCRLSNAGIDTRNAKIIFMYYADGYSYAAIGRKFGLTPQSIRRIVRLFLEHLLDVRRWTTIQQESLDILRNASVMVLSRQK